MMVLNAMCLGSRAHSDRGHYTVGSSAQQTSHRRPSWEVLVDCHYIPLFRPGSHDRRYLVFQVPVPSSVRFGRCCGYRQESIQDQEFRFPDDTQCFRRLEEGFSQRHRVCEIVLSEKLSKLSGGCSPQPVARTIIMQPYFRTYKRWKSSDNSFSGISSTLHSSTLRGSTYENSAGGSTRTAEWNLANAIMP